MQTEGPESETVKPTLARGQPAYVSSCFACVSESPRASCLVILSNQRYISAILVLWSIFQITACLVTMQILIPRPRRWCALGCTLARPADRENRVDIDQNYRNNGPPQHSGCLTYRLFRCFLPVRVLLPASGLIYEHGTRARPLRWVVVRVL